MLPAVLGAPISQLSDRVVPGIRVFGPLAEKTRVAIMSAETDAEMVGGAESLLFSCLPERDPVASQVAELVSLINSDPSLRRVDQLARGVRDVGAELAAVVR